MNRGPPQSGPSQYRHLAHVLHGRTGAPSVRSQISFSAVIEAPSLIADEHESATQSAAHVELGSLIGRGPNEVRKHHAQGLQGGGVVREDECGAPPDI